MSGHLFVFVSRDRALMKALFWDRSGFEVLANNAAERALRAVAIGRRSSLFCGSFEHAALSANLFTVVATATLHGVNLRDDLVWLLRQLARRAWSVEAAAAELLPERVAVLVAAEQAEEQRAWRL
jgi:transposase